MSTSRGARNNVLAGVFVLVAVALAVLCVVLLTNFADQLRPKSRYVVRFGMLDGADGLDAGSPVKVAGQRVGQVEKWAFANDEATGEPIAVDVTFAISRNLKIYSDADVTLLKPLLGGQSAINIAPNPGMYTVSETIGPPILIPPDQLDGPSLRGRLGGPGFLSPSDYARLRGVLANFEAISGQIRTEAPEIIAGAKRTLSTIDKAANEAQGIIADARPIVTDVRQKWPAWSDNVGSVLGRIDAEVKAAEGIAKKITDGVQEVRDLITQGRGVVDDNRPKIAETVENVRAVVDRFRNQEYETFTSAIDNARKTMAEASDAAERVNRLIVTKSPELEALVTSASLTAQQLKLAVGEVRSSPWRLLYQPTKKELENELLYNSVREYANTVSDLRAAADALRAAGDKAGTGTGGIDRAAIDALTGKLQTAFDRYQEQERAFMSRWVEGDGK
jgi:ABC-type transporter Mla subunit MlaD